MKMKPLWSRRRGEGRWSVELQTQRQGKDGQTWRGLVEVGQEIWWLVFVSRLRLIFIPLPLCPWVSGWLLSVPSLGALGGVATKPLLLTWAAGKARDVPKKPQSTWFWGKNSKF